METIIKKDIKISSGNVVVNGDDTGFSLGVLFDQEQFQKKLFFYPEHAESIVEAVTKYIKVRDTLNSLKD